MMKFVLPKTRSAASRLCKQLGQGDSDQVQPILNLLRVVGDEGNENALKLLVESGVGNAFVKLVDGLGEYNGGSLMRNDLFEALFAFVENMNEVPRAAWSDGGTVYAFLASLMKLENFVAKQDLHETVILQLLREIPLGITSILTYVTSKNKGVISKLVDTLVKDGNLLKDTLSLLQRVHDIPTQQQLLEVLYRFLRMIRIWRKESGNIKRSDELVELVMTHSGLSGDQINRLSLVRKQNDYINTTRELLQANMGNSTSLTCKEIGLVDRNGKENHVIATFQKESKLPLSFDINCTSWTCAVALETDSIISMMLRSCGKSMDLNREPRNPILSFDVDSDQAGPFMNLNDSVEKFMKTRKVRVYVVFHDLNTAVQAWRTIQTKDPPKFEMNLAPGGMKKISKTKPLYLGTMVSDTLEQCGDGNNAASDNENGADDAQTILRSAGETKPHDAGVKQSSLGEKFESPQTVAKQVSSSQNDKVSEITPSRKVSAQPKRETKQNPMGKLDGNAIARKHNMGQISEKDHRKSDSKIVAKEVPATQVLGQDDEREETPTKLQGRRNSDEAKATPSKPQGKRTDIGGLITTSSLQKKTIQELDEFTRVHRKDIHDKFFDRSVRKMWKDGGKRPRWRKSELISALTGGDKATNEQDKKKNEQEKTPEIPRKTFSKASSTSSEEKQQSRISKKRRESSSPAESCDKPVAQPQEQEVSRAISGVITEKDKSLPQTHASAAQSSNETTSSQPRHGHEALHPISESGLPAKENEKLIVMKLQQHQDDRILNALKVQLENQQQYNEMLEKKMNDMHFMMLKYQQDSARNTDKPVMAEATPNTSVHVPVYVASSAHSDSSSEDEDDMDKEEEEEEVLEFEEAFDAPEDSLPDEKMDQLGKLEVMCPRVFHSLSVAYDKLGLQAVTMQSEWSRLKSEFMEHETQARNLMSKTISRTYRKGMKRLLSQIEQEHSEVSVLETSIRTKRPKVDLLLSKHTMLEQELGTLLQDANDAAQSLETSLENHQKDLQASLDEQNKVLATATLNFSKFAQNKVKLVQSKKKAAAVQFAKLKSLVSSFSI